MHYCYGIYLVFCINVEFIALSYLQYSFECSIPTALMWNSLDFLFNRLLHNCYRYDGFQKIFIFKNVELYQYSTCISALYRVHHCCGSHLVFFDSSFNRLPNDCYSHAEFQRISIVQNVELYQYSTFIFVAFFRMQRYYGIHLTSLEP